MAKGVAEAGPTVKKIKAFTRRPHPLVIIYAADLIHINLLYSFEDALNLNCILCGHASLLVDSVELSLASSYRERVAMKRLFLGLVAAAFVAFGAGSQVSASTINVNPNPTDHFNVGNFFTAPGSFDDPYQFTLTHDSTVSDNLFTANITGFTLQLFDPSNNPVSFASDLVANVLYTLHVSGNASAGGVYAGQINFAATPVPPALLLFVTALAGLGAAGYRRRSDTPAA